MSIVGGSMGAGDAAIEAAAGEIDRMVLLGGLANGTPERVKGRKLVIVNRDAANAGGPRLPNIRARYEQTPGPKELIVLEGSAHAQFMFATDEGGRVMREILRFLSQP